MSAQHIWKLSWLLGLLTCCKLANLPWNFVTAASKQHPKTIPKTTSVLTLMLRKTGKQRCKNPGVPSVDRGNWGWECDSLFYRVLALREECCVLWRITLYTFISPTKMTIFFRTVRSTNDYAWKPAKWAKFMLVLTRLQISQYEFVLQKHCEYRLEKQTIMLRIVPQMLKNWKIVGSRISKVRQTTCIWIKKILDEATRIVNVFLISWFF